jgi:hypothetical protein
MGTFLSLCQDLRRECLIPGTGPASVLNQTGQMARVVAWIRDAYTEIQVEEPGWRWLRGNFQIVTQANVRTYRYSDTGVTDSDTALAIARFATWWRDPDLQIYLQSAGVGTRGPVSFVEWPDHRRVWLTGSQNPGYPSEWSIDPQDRISFGATPNGVYVAAGEYQKGPQVLAADADVPEMPDRFHQLIVARGMKKYAAGIYAPEVLAAANEIEDTLRRPLEVSQLPQPRFGNPLC